MGVGIKAIYLLCLTVVFLTTSGFRNYYYPNKQLHVLLSDPGLAKLQPDEALEKKLIELVDNSVSGSIIRMSFFRITSMDLANSLVSAFKKGVKVRVIVNREAESSAIDLLKVNLSGESFILHCGDSTRKSCMGVGINHNKFAMFSTTKSNIENLGLVKVENVTVQTSSNMTSPQQNMFNDMIIFYNNLSVYEIYKQYFTDLKSNVLKPNYFQERMSTPPYGISNENNIDIKFYFFQEMMVRIQFLMF